MVYLASRNSAGFKLCPLFCHSNIVSNTAFQTEKLIMKSVFFQHIQHLIFQSSRKHIDLLFLEQRERKIKSWFIIIVIPLYSALKISLMTSLPLLFAAVLCENICLYQIATVFDTFWIDSKILGLDNCMLFNHAIINIHSKKHDIRIPTGHGRLSLAAFKWWWRNGSELH